MKEIVIKIPDNTYKTIKDDIYCGILDPIVYDAIKNGKVLPKGHGRLIDADNIPIDTFFDEWDIPNAETLVEADKGDTDGNK